MMVKQKIVMKVQMEGAKKQAKAFKAAVGLEGVVSVTVEGKKIVVVGDEIDPINLIFLLRKKMGYAEVLAVAAVAVVAEEKDEEKKNPPAEGGKISVQPMTLHYYYQYAMAPQPYIYET